MAEHDVAHGALLAVAHRLNPSRALMIHVPSRQVFVSNEDLSDEDEKTHIATVRLFGNLPNASDTTGLRAAADPMAGMMG